MRRTDRGCRSSGGFLIGGAMVVALTGAFWVAGAALVLDSGSKAASAEVIGHGHRRSLWRLPLGILYVVPPVDGRLVVRCRDGAIWSRAGNAYVSRHRHTWVRLDRLQGCGKVTIMRQDFSA